jgi:copper chaperone NosL
MLISEPVYAAAYQADGHDPRVFDDIGCLLDAAAGETASAIAFWFQDAAGGGWLNADAAIFVASPRVPTPMSGGVLAYADAAAAQQAAAAHQGEVVRSFQDLVNRKEGGTK